MLVCVSRQRPGIQTVWSSQRPGTQTVTCLDHGLNPDGFGFPVAMVRSRLGGKPDGEHQAEDCH